MAESLGGVESLVAHPATMTHAAMSPEARAAAGIGDGLLRLSVGIEALEDLADDLRDALDRAALDPVEAGEAGGHGGRVRGAGEVLVDRLGPVDAEALRHVHAQGA
jgi:hypothetical protein